MISVSPEMNKICQGGIQKRYNVYQGVESGEEEERRTFPRASSAPSKKSITPKSMNKAPNVVSATPISV
jgi:hypothetical protein